MFSCKSTKNITLKQPLSQTNFDEIIFAIKSSKLKFDPIDGVFKQIANEDPYYRKSGEGERLFDEETNIKRDITAKQEKIKNLKSKIEEIEQKHEMMMKILSVDINERAYVNDIKKQLIKK